VGRRESRVDLLLPRDAVERAALGWSADRRRGTARARALSAERVVTDTTTIETDWATAGQAKIKIVTSAPLPGSPTTTTQSPLDNSTKVATTAYVDAAVTAGSGGGGGGSAYPEWDPFVVPGSPHADNDEFDNSATMSNWTAVYNTDTGLTIDINTTVPGSLFYNIPSTQYKLRSLLKTIPGTDFAVYTAVNLGTQIPAGGLLCDAGLIITDGTTAGAGKQTALAIGNNGSAQPAAGLLTWAKFGFDATSAAFSGSLPCDNGIVFLRIRRNSGVYTFGSSYDGVIWRERVETLLTGLTPTNIGLFAQNYGVNVASVRFLFYRMYAVTATQQHRTGAAA
jgi:hypothetical protein